MNELNCSMDRTIQGEPLSSTRVVHREIRECTTERLPSFCFDIFGGFNCHLPVALPASTLGAISLGVGVCEGTAELK